MGSHSLRRCDGARVLVLLSGFQNVENTEPQRNERSSSGSESKVYELRHRIRK